MSTLAKNISAPPRLNGHAVTELWHRRLARTQIGSGKVQPRLCAELLLHPVVSQGARVAVPHSLSARNPLDDCHAA